LKKAYQRYGRPFAITETSHPLEDRPLWLKMIGQECSKALRAGLPLWGVCLYPIVDRPDWDFPDRWHQSGLWDADLSTMPPARVLHQPSATALRAAQATVAAAVPRMEKQPAQTAL
jgi:hypothetical protein